MDEEAARTTSGGAPSIAAVDITPFYDGSVPKKKSIRLDASHSAGSNEFHRRRDGDPSAAVPNAQAAQGL
jgi:hypothetical protein